MKTVFWYSNDSYASVDIHTATLTLGRLGAEERRMLGEKRCIRLAMAQLYRASCSCSHLAYNQPRAAHDQAQGKAATTLQQALRGYWAFSVSCFRGQFVCTVPLVYATPSSSPSPVLVRLCVINEPNSTRGDLTIRSCARAAKEYGSLGGQRDS
jgi:hypothetical protein